MVKVLITGGAGFIGHHVCEHILRNTDWEIVSLDRLDTSGTLNRLADLPIWQKEKRRVRIVHHDLRSELNGHVHSLIGRVDYILHLAAASHVDRSIEWPMDCVLNNVVGTCNILDFAREHGCDKFVYFSTDEVFGPAPRGVQYKEWDRYRSGNPYAATKAGGEELALAYHNTYKLPVLITHTMNVFGERQHPEKYIPSTIAKVLNGNIVMVHGSPDGEPGSRFYIHARNVAAAVLFLLKRGELGGKYNIVGECEIDNLELAVSIANVLNRSLNYRVVDYHSSRPGHDLRYALDDSLMLSLGWKPPVWVGESLAKTIRWTVSHPEWLTQVDQAA